MSGERPMEIERVGRRELKHELPKVVKRTVHRGRSAALTYQGKVEAMLVPPEVFDELRAAQGEAERLRSAIPLLVAAARAGVAIPSASLDRLGIGLDFDWRALNAFQARLGIEITHDEEGHPLPPMPAAEPAATEESDEELILG
jgi:antitoxin (DNA-binding transcriptional repressor) of toxin-antitoxin stability system